MFTYLYSTEKIAAKKSKGEVLLFRRSHLSVSKHYDVCVLVDLLRLRSHPCFHLRISNKVAN
jgi:hypothetical protein